MIIKCCTNKPKELGVITSERGLRMEKFSQFSSAPQNALDIFRFVLENAEQIAILAKILIDLASDGWTVNLSISRDTKEVRTVKKTDTYEEVTEEIQKSFRIDFIKK